MTQQHQRLYSMDAARSILMTLGIFLHTAVIYGLPVGWYVHSSPGDPFFTGLWNTIHLFRMPAFFIISGFFCMLTLQRYGAEEFLKRRLVRIAVPLVFVALTLNSAQSFISGKPPSGPLTAAYWLQDGGWVTHLWFLIYLIIYFLCAYALTKASFFRPLFARIAKLLARLGESTRLGMAMLVVVVLPAASLSVVLLGQLVPFLHDEIAGVLRPLSVIKYSVFFVFGTVLYFKRELLAEFSIFNVYLLAFFVAASLLYFQVDEQSSVLYKLLQEYLYAAIVWCLCSFVFLFFDTFFSRHSNGFMRLADASYSIYLLHHITVIVLGMLFLNIALPVGIEYIIIVASTFALTYFIHRQIIMRSSLLSYCMNGVKVAKDSAAEFERSQSAS